MLLHSTHSFIRWQFNTLKANDKVRFGKRANVFSVLDGQVCADHDRATGEGVGPQDGVVATASTSTTNASVAASDAARTITVVVLFQRAQVCVRLITHLQHTVNNLVDVATVAASNPQVFLAPATLRPETMYGQTNCFVLPEGVYGAYSWANGDVLIVSERGARGLAHQGYAKDWGKVQSHTVQHHLCPRLSDYWSHGLVIPASQATIHPMSALYSLCYTYLPMCCYALECLIGDLTGQELMGLPLSAPNAVYPVVYTLPLLTISMAKGTGIVTSVPSDAPDDYAALKELKEKELFRAKFGLTDE
eukprot:3160-Heterococcus_DN1.PRE.8